MMKCNKRNNNNRIIIEGGPSTPTSKFRDNDLETLYQTYNVRQKRPAIHCYLCTCILFNIYILITCNQIHAITIVFLILTILAVAWCYWSRNPVWIVMPYFAWTLSNIQLILQLYLQQSDTLSGNEHLGWVLLFNYLIFVALPLNLISCFVLSALSCILYLSAIAIIMKVQGPHLVQKMVANFIVMITSVVLGLISFFLADKQQRAAFLETRQRLKMKLAMEEQSAEQERLLLSVLPEHVAVKMRQDLGSALDTQFKKIYMSRHENVSILYADIVGFTAISSTYSASELVKILNELFARFDRLAERYHQLRIKILGDCYYCISGAPRERSDHAILSVQMGLSMVQAIKYVQQKTNSPVDMRVGIHTGAVLAGVLGQRQWQFDVYSKDVELANKMESSGLPGRVHISEKTLSYLNNEFEVEPAYGEKREEALRIAGIKTFFIVNAKQPIKELITEGQNGAINEDKLDKKETVSEIPGERKKSSKSDLEGFKIRLKKELMNRDGYKDLSKHTSILTLLFKDANKEREYNYHNDNLSSFSLIACPLVLLFTSLAQVFVLPRDALSFCSFSVGFILLLCMMAVSIAEALPNYFPEALVYYSRALTNSADVRRGIALMAVILLAATSIIDLIPCEMNVFKSKCNFKSDESEECLYPSYFTHFMVLVLIAISMISHLSHIVKALLLIVITATQCIVNMFVIKQSIRCEEIITKMSYLEKKSNRITLSVLLICVSQCLAFLGRHMEKSSRVLFLWKNEVEEQREKASDIGRRNEALVYNILPKHVAVHFLGEGRTRQHEELYSQSYSEVGVLFASMPNFSDFYSEETVNNQGLECLRFLNEVISDFDALLELPQFQDIIKIKTIGSTYMAASGLNSCRIIKPDDAIEVRWAHLSLLVEFALELKKALQSINEQSFNHFVLKMGINHGPIIAGVIGARKPHYDIWGNTVNVASRMESTGKAGCIQVTEETCCILQHFGYRFEQRGLVAVKGKGQLMTYYLIGKGCTHPLPLPSMETLKEEEEEDDECNIESKKEEEVKEIQESKEDESNNDEREAEKETLLPKT